MVFQKILVALDGSEHSDRALEVAIQLAKQLKSRLKLLTVYHVTVTPVTSPELTMNRPVFVPDTLSNTMAIEAARDFGKKILAEAEAKARSEKIEVETELAEGHAANIIVSKSDEGKFDMIIMGARGLSTIKKIFIGSVSESVVRNALCPVLLVK